MIENKNSNTKFTSSHLSIESHDITSAEKWVRSLFNYQFKDPKLLYLALKHSSMKKGNNDDFDNERLEFLGDSVLSLIISEKIYLKFNQLKEGKLSQMRSKLVNNKKLSQLAKHIKLNDQILLGESVLNNKDKGSSIIGANTLEALIGAIYLDTQSFEKTSKMIAPLFDHSLGELKNSKTLDAKSLLQNYCHKKQLPLPTYYLVSEQNDIYKMACRVLITRDQSVLCYGEHRQKKIAEQIAAKEILNMIEKNQ